MQNTPTLNLLLGSQMYHSDNEKRRKKRKMRRKRMAMGKHATMMRKRIMTATQ
jgi:hypothetical protein